MMCELCHSLGLWGSTSLLPTLFWTNQSQSVNVVSASRWSDGITALCFLKVFAMFPLVLMPEMWSFHCHQHDFQSIILMLHLWSNICWTFQLSHHFILKDHVVKSLALLPTPYLASFLMVRGILHHMLGLWQLGRLGRWGPNGYFALSLIGSVSYTVPFLRAGITIHQKEPLLKDTA